MEKQLEQQYSNCIKVVLYGPESTGKTTLAQKLAVHYDTEWVPEFSRGYLQKKWDQERQICGRKDILPIAAGQMQLENTLAKKANKVLFCDTNLLEIVVYSQAYFDGFCEPLLLKQALKAQYDIYFLTYIDVPWVEDDLRDRPHQRELMFDKFKKTLDHFEKSYVTLKGGFQERFGMAVKTIDKLIKDKVLDFNTKDVSQIEAKGLTTAEVEKQIAIFKRGNIAMNIREAATIKNGIISCSEEEKERLNGLYESKKDNLDVLKFVPASGAATRMFKAFYKFLKNYDPKKESVDEYTERKNDPKLEMFFSRMEQLPFYDEVKQKAVAKNPNYEELSEDEQQLLFVKAMLGEEGANFGNYPKGLVPFHKYEDRLVTAFEEHLIEAADYATSNGVARLHFTVSKEHRSKFEKEFERIKGRVEKETGVQFQVSYSFQDEKTDTVAVTKENEPFRDEKGDIFFRPGGHGALLENLNRQEADVIFIKNIDNVVIPKNREVLAESKKMLAGKLLELQGKTFQNLKKLQNEEISEEELSGIISFAQDELNAALSVEFDTLGKDEKITVLKQKLNRPMRVCGMVKNEGEPGGGPFWVTHSNGEISLQIVESAQIDHDNYQQSKIAQEATHFNPVDVVCGKKDFKGENFVLHDYVDEETSFIANKTKDGKELKALERPGLWNGGMANWITIFVEVPVETFNPVKTVADLLKPTHQVK